jgi:retinol dehydrogenase 12
LGDFLCTEIQAATGFERLRVGVIELSSFDSVSAFADTLEKENDRLDVLILNAGVVLEGYEPTPDGWDTT